MRSNVSVDILLCENRVCFSDLCPFGESHSLGGIDLYKNFGIHKGYDLGINAQF